MVKRWMLEKTLKDIEPFTSEAEKNSRFCIGCGEPATKLFKYNTEAAIIVDVIDAQKLLKIALLINIKLLV